MPPKHHYSLDLFFSLWRSRNGCSPRKTRDPRPEVAARDRAPPGSQRSGGGRAGTAICVMKRGRRQHDFLSN